MKKHLLISILAVLLSGLLILFQVSWVWHVIWVFFINIAVFFLLYLLSRSTIGITKEDRAFMELAFAEAEKALETGNHPIGAVFVVDGHVIAKGYTTTRSSGDQRNHAELVVLNEAMKVLQIQKDFSELKNRRVVLYTTSEPCPFCRGFIVYKKIPKVVVGERHYSFHRHCTHLLTYLGMIGRMRSGISEERQLRLYDQFKAQKSKNSLKGRDGA